MSTLAKKIHLCTMNDIFAFIKANPDLPLAKAKALVTLSQTVLKKYEDDQNSEADAAALDLFKRVNADLIDKPLAESELELTFLGMLREELYRFWWVSDSDNISVCNHLSDILDAGRTGPGSSLGAEGFDFYSKMFASKLTTTSELLYRNYSYYVSSCPLWHDAEKHRALTKGAYSVVECSRLGFVPKNNVISRTICTEPSLNMFYQLGLGKLLERRLASWGINLSCQQSINRDLAYQGSIDGSFATIDLSSASDTLSVGVLKDILPAQFFRWLMLLRTSSVELPDGDKLQLRMISTMGNGYTFPLQTVIFSAVVRVVLRLHRLPMIWPRKKFEVRSKANDIKRRLWSVNGDDIICVTEIANDVLHYLQMLGFKPNATKSFVNGPFRESCGRDFFNGHDVRGVYIKSLRSPQDRYVAINLFNDWSARTGVPLFSTVQCLLAEVPRVLVPPDLGMDAGIHVPSHIAKPPTNKHGVMFYTAFKVKGMYQKVTVHNDVLRDAGYTGPITGDSVTFVEYKEKRGSKWVTIKTEPNLSGLSIAFLGGYVRKHKIAIRQNRPSYAKKPGCTPMWDVLPEPDRSYRRFCFAQWSLAVHVNLAWY